MELYFLRHGQAEDAASWNGNDFDRPLTDDGRERMARQAKTMKQLVRNVDAIVTSPLVRAQQTATIVADALKMRDRLVEDARLALNFDAEQLTEILRSHDGATALILVGHEPSMSATIGRLIGEASVQMKKGSLARVDLPDSMQRGELVWLLPPKVLLL
jgi:phosphohistidine phosphatase